MPLDLYRTLTTDDVDELNRELIAVACLDATIRVAWGEFEAVAVLVDVVAERIARFRVRVEAKA